MVDALTQIGWVAWGAPANVVDHQISTKSPASSRHDFSELLRARRVLRWSWVPLVVLGAGLQLVWGSALVARFAWLMAAGACIGPPFAALLAFRCPRCEQTYLASGGLRDFFGLRRILWSRECGSCGLQAASTRSKKKT